jgi:predicted Zn-dependent protease
MIRSFLLLILLAATVSLRAADPAVGGSGDLERAKREFQNARFAEALAALDESEKNGGASGRSLDFRGRILLEQGQLDEAAKLFVAAHAKDTATLAQLHLGDVLLRQNKFADAREAYRTATKETSLLPLYERLRFGLLLTYLREKDDVAAQQALDLVKFPSESGAYYFAQAAWAFAHDQKRDGEKWIKRADEIYAPKLTTWYKRWFFDLGWTKDKPALVADY